MEQYKKEFIEFMIDCNVLKFGDFVTKSGRNTPFFVNTGFYRTGAQLKKLGEYYATAIHNKFGLDFDVLFGPAYKGIPLSVAATMAISDMYESAIKENESNTERLNANIKRLNEQLLSERKVLEERSKEKNELNGNLLEMETKYDKLSREFKAKEKDFDNNINIEIQKYQKMENY